MSKSLRVRAVSRLTSPAARRWAASAALRPTSSGLTAGAAGSAGADTGADTGVGGAPGCGAAPSVSRISGGGAGASASTSRSVGSESATAMVELRSAAA